MVKKVLLGAIGLAVLLGLTACDPFTIRLTVDRKVVADYGPGSGDDFLRLTGTIQCSESEPVDLSFSVYQYGPNGQVARRSGGSEAGEACGPEQRTWSHVWELYPSQGLPQVQPGEATLELTGCTNPGSRELEDCLFIRRGVIIFEGQLAT